MKTFLFVVLRAFRVLHVLRAYELACRTALITNVSGIL